MPLSKSTARLQPSERSSACLSPRLHSKNENERTEAESDLPRGARHCLCRWWMDGLDPLLAAPPLLVVPGRSEHRPCPFRVDPWASWRVAFFDSPARLLLDSRHGRARETDDRILGRGGGGNARAGALCHCLPVGRAARRGVSRIQYAHRDDRNLSFAGSTRSRWALDSRLHSGQCPRSLAATGGLAVDGQKLLNDRSSPAPLAVDRRRRDRRPGTVRAEHSADTQSYWSALPSRLDDCRLVRNCDSSGILWSCSVGPSHGSAGVPAVDRVVRYTDRVTAFV